VTSANGLSHVDLSPVRSMKQWFFESALLAIGAEIVGVCLIWATFGSWKRSQLAESATWGSIPCIVVFLAALWLTRKMSAPRFRCSLDYHRHNIGLVVFGGFAAFILMALAAFLVVLDWIIWFALHPEILQWHGVG
jgi:hypothetical protein